jgi:hypothetical protein
LRCDADADQPCPAGTTCTCQDDLLPARIDRDCDNRAAGEFRICARPDRSIIDPYADRFEDILGSESLVSREVVRDADHMVQE